MPDQTKRDFLNTQVSMMKQDRDAFIPHWRSLAEYVKPRRGQFVMDNPTTRASKSFASIINGAATKALKTASAGMLAGVMSPSRPWFRITTQNPELRARHDVRIWLSLVETKMREIFNTGNIYNMAPNMIGELLLFGTGCMTHVDDFEDVSRFYAHTVGSYMIAQDERLMVRTLAREYQLTADQMVREFGKENVSTKVRDAWDRGEYLSRFDVIHFIGVNPNFKPNSNLSKFKAYRSVKYEPGDNMDEKFLSEKGFDEFPAYCPRWETTAEDVYATSCPGMEALGDIKGLQIEEKRKAQGIDKQVNPPLQGPAEFKNVQVMSVPGGVTIANLPPGRDGLRPIYTVNPDVTALAQDIDRVAFRIQQAFFVDLFLAISNMQGIQPRNEREIAERNAERLLQLGPVLEQLHGSWLEPMIDRQFAQMVRAEILPPIPEELQGANLKIEFISSLALAQKAVQLGGVERFVAFVATLAQSGKAEALDKINTDLLVDEYGDLNGVDPRFIVATEDAEEARAVRAQQEQQILQLQQAQAAATAAQTASNAKLDDDNVLSRAAGPRQ